MAKATPAADANLYRACSVAAREFFLLERGGGELRLIGEGGFLLTLL